MDKTTSPRTRLTFDEPSGRWRLGIDDLHGGDVLELEVSQDVWLPVRFEWVHQPVGSPKGVFVMWLPDELEVTLSLPVGARLRTPSYQAA